MQFCSADYSTFVNYGILDLTFPGLLATHIQEARVLWQREAMCIATLSLYHLFIADWLHFPYVCLGYNFPCCKLSALSLYSNVCMAQEKP